MICDVICSETSADARTRVFDSPSPTRNSIGVTMIIWRLGGKIIGTVSCYTTALYNYMHTRVYSSQIFMSV